MNKAHILAEIAGHPKEHYLKIVFDLLANRDCEHPLE